MYKGFWDETQEVYADAECSGQKQYEIFMSGTYHLTGKKSTDVEDFWNINYFVDTRTIRVFTLTFQNMLLDETSCGIGQVVLGRSMDITDVRCAVLNIVPFSEVSILIIQIVIYRMKYLQTLDSVLLLMILLEEKVQEFGGDLILVVNLIVTILIVKKKID